VLARLEPANSRTMLTMAQRELEASRRNLAEIEVRLAEADRNLKRNEALVQQQLISQTALDASKAEVNALAARLAASQAQVKVAESGLQMRQIDFDDIEVKAPFDGVVISKNAQPGEMISPLSAGGAGTRTGIGTLVDMDSLEVQVDVNESFIGRVKAKQPIVAVLNAYPDWKIPGEVIAIVPTADRGKATVKVRISLKEKDARIVPEMGVRVSFLEAAAAPGAPVPEAPKGVLVPASAVGLRDGKQVAFVVKGEVVEQRTVAIGRTLGDDREVTQGLSGGDVVVLDPPKDLADGARVRVADPEN
jgi:RND family efflux transporter MFP subunit